MPAFRQGRSVTASSGLAVFRVPTAGDVIAAQEQAAGFRSGAWPPGGSRRACDSARHRKTPVLRPRISRFAGCGCRLRFHSLASLARAGLVTGGYQSARPSGQGHVEIRASHPDKNPGQAAQRRAFPGHPESVSGVVLVCLLGAAEMKPPPAQSRNCKGRPLARVRGRPAMAGIKALPP